MWLVNLAGRTLLHGPLRFNVISVAKLLRDLSPKLLNYLASKGLKLSFTLNCVLKRANDLKTISNWLVLLSTCFRNLKPFLMVRNRSRTRQTHNRDIINILLTSFLSPYCKLRILINFSLRFMASALQAWAINRRGKNLVCNLRYGPRTQLLRGIYYMAR